MRSHLIGNLSRVRQVVPQPNFTAIEGVFVIGLEVLPPTNVYHGFSRLRTLKARPGISTKIHINRLSKSSLLYSSRSSSISKSSQPPAAASLIVTTYRHCLSGQSRPPFHSMSKVGNNVWRGDITTSTPLVWSKMYKPGAFWRKGSRSRFCASSYGWPWLKQVCWFIKFRDPEILIHINVAMITLRGFELVDRKRSSAPLERMIGLPVNSNTENSANRNNIASEYFCWYEMRIRLSGYRRSKSHLLMLYH